MRRRAFITLLGGASAWPIAVRAQQPQRMRRIGVLMLYVEDDPEGQARANAFRQLLEKLGWAAGRNLQIDYRWGVGDGDWIGSAAAELVTRVPDVILANGGPAARAVQQATLTVPTIFIGGADPVADGFVQLDGKSQSHKVPERLLALNIPLCRLCCMPSSASYRRILVTEGIRRQRLELAI
jgi:putative tryptophan/tyrosine transport system substrate-binding protein